MSEKETYLTRAAEARAEAESATLDNVRERCLRSEAAWNEMASRVERTQRLRAEKAAATEAASAKE